MRHRLFAVLMMLSLWMLAGCGTKGPLFLPPTDTERSLAPADNR